jgi:hypothetical protein
VEIGADSLPAAANNEDIAFTSYTSLAGYQTLISSPNSSFYKIMNANPGSLVDIFNASKSFKGLIKVNNGRTLLWKRNEDKVNKYGSYIDTQTVGVNYTAVNNEVIGTGNGALFTFANTLAFKGAGSRRTCFSISVTDGVETFTDNRNGVLTGSAGGTGTINYATGAISVTFIVPPLNLQNITANYLWEDSGVKGLSDFSYSSPRQASEGYFLQQGTGGDLMDIQVFGEVFYCLHKNAAWFVNMPANDLNPTNKIYRDRIGFTNIRGAVSTGDGIFYIDVTYPEKPSFSLIRFGETNPEVQPYVLTYNVNLEGYDMSDLAVGEYGNLIIYAMKSSSSAAANDVMFVYNKDWKSLDRLDYNTRVFAEKDGFLWAGDSLSTNVLELFSGFDDNDSKIDNFWTGDISELGVEALKKTKRLYIEGYIGLGQTINVYLSLDKQAFALVGSIDSNGTYVDKTDPVLIGASGIGMKEIGGGGAGTEAFYYNRELRIRTDRFRTAQVKFEATGIGFASVSTQNWYDVKTYTQKQPLRFK